MELKLDREEAALLHQVVESYLDDVRTAFGHGEADARVMLEGEQEILERVLRDLHSLAGRKAEGVAGS